MSVEASERLIELVRSNEGIANHSGSCDEAMIVTRKGYWVSSSRPRIVA